MKLTEFDYKLPNNLIAHYPNKNRSASRLLLLDRKTNTIQHKHFYDLVDLISPNDLLIFNDSRVIPARLFGNKETGGKIEILIERILDKYHALAHIKASRAPKPNSIIHLANSINLKATSRQQNLFALQFPHQHPVMQTLASLGHIPLPPYIKRADETLDHERYQTVYARHDGSVAAPTAGLHFDNELLQKLINKGIDFSFVTLHVGAGTFQPIKTSNIKQHHMHAELIKVTPEVCDQINTTKNRGGRIIAVGTTSVRCLETAAKNGKLQPYYGETDIFIYPGFCFQCVDAMITNFHLPKSTLLMLVCALAGRDKIMHAYDIAIKNQYRFYSYGDAMMIV
jgi:S-adenosylmethionine:tRNA ribosyltransferase-isomerase